MKKIFWVGLIFMLVLSACGASGDIQVQEPWARSGGKGDNSAVYFMLNNNMKEADALVGAASDVADMVQVHRSLINDQGVAEMVHQDSVPLDAGSKTEFAPGGLHVMLMGLKQDLNAGDHFQVTLQFQNHADVVIDAVVKDVAAGSGMSGMGGNSNMGGGMAGAPANNELTAVGKDGAAVPMSMDVEKITGKLPMGSAAQMVGDMIVTLRLNPYPPTMRQTAEFTVNLTDMSGQAIDDASITLDLTMPEMAMPTNKPELAFVSDGEYQGSGFFTMRGWWRIEVMIDRGGQMQSAFFDVGL